MTIPKTSVLTLPLLKLLKDGNEHSMDEVEDTLASLFGLTDEERKETQKPDSNETKLRYQIAWSTTHLIWAELIERRRRSHIKITSEGSDLLNENLPDLTESYLTNRFPKFAQRRRRGSMDMIWTLEDLTKFIESKMNTQYNYQPVVILSLLKCPNFTSSTNLIAEQLARFNSYRKDYSRALGEAIDDTMGTDHRGFVKRVDNNTIKLLLEGISGIEKNNLIELCYEKIAEWDSENTLSEDAIKEKIPDSSQIYLLQVGEKGSQEILENKYRYEGWANFESNKRDRVYGEVNPGDFLLVYFTNDSVIHSKMVKMVYVVSTVSDDHVELKLKPVKQLTGVHLDTVRKNRDSGKLGEKFNLVGQSGNITKISRQDYLDMTMLDYKSKLSVSENTFTTSKSIVNKIMKEHERGPFTDLTSFLKDEKVEGHKLKILEKAKDVLKKDSGDIIETLKEACTAKVVGSLFNLQNGLEVSEARILYALNDEDETTRQKFKQKLSDFLSVQTEIDFGKRWDSLVSEMKSIKSKNTSPDFLFLSYLAFLQNSQLHIPFTPTKADEVFQFFELDFEKVSQKNGVKGWQNYSLLLELTNELRLRLADHSELDLIDIQGYMWILANAIKKGIKPPGGRTHVLKPDEIQKFKDVLEWKPNLILYGPPGTGKTYHANEIAEEITKGQVSKIQKIWLWPVDPKNWEVVPVKKTWGSHEKISKLKQKFSKNDLVVFYVTTTNEIQGIFKFTGEWYNAKENIWPIDSDNENNENNDFGNYIDVEEIVLGHLDIRTLHKSLDFFDGLTSIPQLTGKLQSKRDILRGPAGELTRKDVDLIAEKMGIILKPEFIKKVTFHQTFSYEEFIEGIKANPTRDGTGVSYGVEQGIFTEFCKTAELDDSDNQYVMIIDEINRGNIAKIFGELITIIEKDKRGKPVTLAYSKQEFSVPKNVLIIGTMNMVDQGLTSLDAALKRRFTMMEHYPDATVLENKVVDEKINLTDLLAKINANLTHNKFRDGQIGHSYFMDAQKPLTKTSELQMVFAYDIIPLLKDYFYDDESKIADILGDGWLDEDGNIEKDWQGIKGIDKFYENIQGVFSITWSASEKEK